MHLRSRRKKNIKDCGWNTVVVLEAKKSVNPRQLDLYLTWSRFSLAIGELTIHKLAENYSPKQDRPAQNFAINVSLI
jgi:hypothetical protein